MAVGMTLCIKWLDIWENSVGCVGGGGGIAASADSFLVSTDGDINNDDVVLFVSLPCCCFS